MNKYKDCFIEYYPYVAFVLMSAIYTFIMFEFVKDAI